jgi:hypothetical protein
MTMHYTMTYFFTHSHSYVLSVDHLTGRDVTQLLDAGVGLRADSRICVTINR